MLKSTFIAALLAVLFACPLSLNGQQAIALTFVNKTPPKNNGDRVLYYQSGQKLSNQVAISITDSTESHLTIPKGAVFELRMPCPVSDITLNKVEHGGTELTGWHVSTGAGTNTLQLTNDGEEVEGWMTLTFDLIIPFSGPSGTNMSGTCQLTDVTNFSNFTTDYLTNNLLGSVSEANNSILVGFNELAPQKKTLNLSAVFAQDGGAKKNVVYVGQDLSNTIAIDLINNSDAIQEGQVFISCPAGDQTWDLAPYDQMPTSLNFPQAFSNGNSWSSPQGAYNQTSGLFIWTATATGATLLQGFGKGNSIRVEIEGIKTTLAHGPVEIMIQFKNMTNFQDATYFLTIQKEEPKPSLLSFTCLEKDNTIQPGGAVNLSWQTFDVDEVRLGYFTPDGQEVTVRPEKDRNPVLNTPGWKHQPQTPFTAGQLVQLTLNAYKGGLLIESKQVVVTVLQAPVAILKFEGKIQGNQIIFTYNVANATRILINNTSVGLSNGEDVTTFPVQMSSTVPQPFIMTAENAKGKTTSKLVPYNNGEVTYGKKLDLSILPPVAHMAISADGNTLYMMNGSVLLIYDISNMDVPPVLKKSIASKTYKDEIVSMFISPSGKKIAITYLWYRADIEQPNILRMAVFDAETGNIIDDWTVFEDRYSFWYPRIRGVFSPDENKIYYYSYKKGKSRPQYYLVNVGFVVRDLVSKQTNVLEAAKFDGYSDPDLIGDKYFKTIAILGFISENTLLYRDFDGNLSGININTLNVTGYNIPVPWNDPGGFPNFDPFSVDINPKEKWLIAPKDSGFSTENILTRTVSKSAPNPASWRPFNISVSANAPRMAVYYAQGSSNSYEVWLYNTYSLKKGD